MLECMFVRGRERELLNISDSKLTPIVYSIAFTKCNKCDVCKTDSRGLNVLKRINSIYKGCNLTIQLTETDTLVKMFENIVKINFIKLY